MASTQIQTSSSSIGGGLGGGGSLHTLARAGSRVWALVQGGVSGSSTFLNLWYSDNDGGSWTEKTIGAAADSASIIGSITTGLNGATWELHGCFAGGPGGTSVALTHFSIISNADSGTPGTVNLTTVDAGGANLGVDVPSICVSPTGSNPRVWIAATKTTAVNTFESRAWFAAMGTATPTFSTTNFTNLNGATTTSWHESMVDCAYWKVSAADKVTIVVLNRPPTPDIWKAFTFDPTAATPTPGSGTTFGPGDIPSDVALDGPLHSLFGKDDYLVFGRHQATAGTVDFYKTVNGTSWSSPSGWTGLTMGRFQGGSDGTDLWLVQSASFGALGTTVQQLQYRKITTSSDTLGGVTNFSDTNGNSVAVPRLTGTSNLYGVYRGSTASPYTVRSDFVSIGGAADTTPPGSASLSAIANTVGARVDLSATMPADTDVAQYEIRRLTTGYPAPTRLDGTVIVAPTATSANSVVTFSDTSLTNSTRYYYRVFVKDTSGNWNTGSTATAVAATITAFLQRYTSTLQTIADGVTPTGNNPVVEFQPATTDFESGKVANFRLRSGNDSATPPTQSLTDYTSSAGGSVFRYEEPAASGTFVDVPTSGLPTTFHGRKLRVYTSETGSSRWFSLRVEQ